MIRRLLCWLGWHEWEFFYHLRADKSIFTNEHFIYKCKHCPKRKVKK